MRFTCPHRVTFHASEYDDFLCCPIWAPQGARDFYARRSIDPERRHECLYSGARLKPLPGYVTEEVHSVMWDPRDNPESWKDFVELAKKAGAQFLSMDEEVLERDELDYLIQRLQHASYPSDEDMEEARWLRNYLGKTGFIQLGWPHQGIMFLYEATTEWYERYQHLLDLVEDFGTLAIDDTDQDDEH